MISRNFVSSDHSDEENELWARTVDLPGFDDNVSPQNVITVLLRLIIGEVRKFPVPCLLTLSKEDSFYLYISNCTYIDNESVIFLSFLKL